MSNHRRLCNARVAEKTIFHLEWMDILSSLNDVLSTTGNLCAWSQPRILLLNVPIGVYRCLVSSLLLISQGSGVHFTLRHSRASRLSHRREPRLRPCGL